MKVLKNVFDILVGIAIIAAAGMMGWKQFRPQPTMAGGRAATENVDLQIPMLTSNRLFGISDTAVVEFTDYECPFCKQYSTTVLPKVKNMNVSYFSFNLPLPMHQHAEGAALSAICAAQQGGLNKMHEKLFTSPLDPSKYGTYADEIGIDTNKFKLCTSAQQTKEILASHKELVKRLNVKGTPTIFVGKITGKQIHLTQRVDSGALEAELKRIGG